MIFRVVAAPVQKVLPSRIYLIFFVTGRILTKFYRKEGRKDADFGGDGVLSKVSDRKRSNRIWARNSSLTSLIRDYYHVRFIAHLVV